MSQRCQLRTRAAQQKSVFFDHLVSCHKQRLWDSEAERFRRLEVDCKHIFHRRLHRQIGRLFASENAIDVTRRAPKIIDLLSPIG
jgi:hypothetical protein